MSAAELRGGHPSSRAQLHRGLRRRCPDRAGTAPVPRSVKRMAAGLLLGVGAMAVAAELTHRAASGWYLGGAAAPEEDAEEAVVVLGFADPGSTAGYVNRRRVHYALRSRRGRRSRLIASGGAVAGPVAEADLLAAHARRLGYSGTIVTESASRSTWENIRNTIPLIDGAQRIVIVSDALHAAKARFYLHQQRPDLAMRLAPADSGRPGEDLALKVPTAIFGVLDLLCARWAKRGTHRQSVTAAGPRMRG